MYRKLLPLCLVLILAACQSGPQDAMEPTPTSFPKSFQGQIQAGPFQLKIQCEGEGEPTIILEHIIDGLSWDASSLARFKKISRTCMYAREVMAGKQLDGPLTSMDAVKDLRTLLTQTGVPGPYLLVGHFSADFNMIIFTDQYPQDVVGLVCVDCFSAGIHQNFQDKLDAKIPKNTELFRQTQAEFDHLYTWTNSATNLDALASEEQVLKVSSLGDRPFIVLVAGIEKHGYYVFGFLDEEINQLFEETWLETSQELSKLSTRGRIEVLPSEDMWSILDNQEVDAAVREVYAAVKADE
jgi:hypothetical protein